MTIMKHWHARTPLTERSECRSVVVEENADFLVELRPFLARQGAVVAGGLAVTKVDQEAGVLQKHCLKQGACKIHTQLEPSTNTLTLG